jgi:hypothetical protein
VAGPELAAVHKRRLRDMWRSAGWPCRDPVELDLLAAGLLQRQWDEQGRETLRVTDLGIELLATARRRSQAARGAHEELVERVARAMQSAGRLVWRGLSLRAPLVGEDGRTQWQIAMPDVFSIRHTTVEDWVEPVVHEIKVSRADLLADLRRPSKAQAYQALCSQCWYVVKRGIAVEADVPHLYGLMVADERGLEVVRPAPQRPQRLSFGTWMALAKAHAEPGAFDDKQELLGEAGEGPAPSTREDRIDGIE